MINLTKTELRKEFKNKRNSINKYTRIENSKQITNCTLEYLSAVIKCENILIYQSFSSEVETGELIKKLYKSGRNVLIPHCDTITETMKAAVYNYDQKQTVNIYGISEFREPIYYDGVIDVIIVPGIAFDKQGNRIGFGKGYYDKFIKKLNPRPFLIGLAYCDQVYDGTIPADEYDMKMNAIITEKGILNIG